MLRETAPGRYRLFVHETGDTLSGTRVIDLRESTSIVVSPDHRSQRTNGLVLGIGGMVAAVVGGVVLLSNTCVEECGSQNGGAAGLGLVLMLSGLAAVPIGWTMFGRSFKPDLTLTPLQERLGDRRSVTAFDGTRLGFTVSF